MAHYIVKLHNPATGNDNYLLWSTIVDAPITYGMSLDDFKDMYHKEYGDAGLKILPGRLERVEATGTSAHNEDLAGIIECNRAGKNGAHLTRKQLIKQYCQ